MSLKDKLILLKKELIGNSKLSSNHKMIIKDFFDGGSVQLTKEQFDYLKSLYLTDGYVVGLHNTSAFNVGHIFEVGLHNYNYIGKESPSLSNTVMYTSLFCPLLSYHSLNYVTVILMIPEKVLEGKRNLFEGLKDGYWGIPPQYIIGALVNGKVIVNKKNYNPNYFNKNAFCIDDYGSFNARTKEQKDVEVSYCEKLFNEQLGKERGFSR